MPAERRLPRAISPRPQTSRRTRPRRDNQAVSVQNLFYLNNVMHDRLYKYGFNEAAGNFQNNNFGKGGATGSDAVNAEAQDGGGLDNATSRHPRDGSAPRMQMYLFAIPVRRRTRSW
jgi:hypothetical protein